MRKLFLDFLKEEDGLGTTEIVILVAILIGVALIFRKYIVQFVSDKMRGMFNRDDLNDLNNIKESGS